MTHQPLAPWPSRSTMLEPEPLAAWRKEAEYQNARAEAAIARIHVLVSALTAVTHAPIDQFAQSRLGCLKTIAQMALDEIGPLPPPPPTTANERKGE